MSAPSSHANSGVTGARLTCQCRIGTMHARLTRRLRRSRPSVAWQEERLPKNPCVAGAFMARLRAVAGAGVLSWQQ